MKLHAFVAMPFGSKPDASGQMVDFNAIYAELLKPALEQAGLDVIRADEEQRAGDIRLDMFQELLMADLVLVDLSIDNPNVWYELGVRHALRARGVVLVQAPRDSKPFDIYTDRKLVYHLKDGKPDPEHLKENTAAIADICQATLEARHAHTVSPVYALLPNLSEPDWKTLRIGAVNEFWERHDEWADLVERARKAGRAEDILTLAEEAPVTALRVEARLKAGQALLDGKHFHFALEQFELALGFDPSHLDAARQRGLCLQRLGREDEARIAYKDILAEHPQDAETWSLLGRLDKDAWVATWDHPGNTTPEQRRADAAYEDALLLRAIQSYETAFRADPGHFYSGINAVTLMRLYHDLVGDNRFKEVMDHMAGGVAWAASCEQAEDQLYWAKATLGDLAVLEDKAAAVCQAYKVAIACADKNWFALDSTLGQLRLLDSLGFASEQVSAGISTFERALARLQAPEQKWQPDKVFLFSGHRIDAPDRKVPRFPASQESIAANAIAKALDELGANGDDLALTQGASGGDLLFAEACLARKLRVQLLLPLPEPEFIARSLLPSEGGEDWRKRYYALRDHPLCLKPRVMPDCLGPLPKDRQGHALDPFERCNRWLLNSALTCGISRTRFICLWNGSGGDGPGGTEHMMKEVKKRTGQVSWLDTRTLWNATKDAHPS